MPLFITNIPRAQGITLIELMVALALSAILLLGVGTVYKASQSSYQINNEIAEQQENARFALNTLTQQIRMAGYSGSNNIDDFRLNVISSNPPPGFDHGVVGSAILPSPFNVNTYVIGHTNNGGWSPPLGVDEVGLDPATGSTITAGSDALIIRGASACSADVTNATNPALTVAGNCDFQEGDAVIVTDGRTADMFTITNSPTGTTPTLMHNTTANRQGNLSNTYVANSRVFKAQAAVYYIGTDPGNPASIPGLWVRRLVNNSGSYVPASVLLIPNVEYMSITYALDTDGDTSRGFDINNLTADQVDALTKTNVYQPALVKEQRQGMADTAWSRVVRIDIQLLFTSEPMGNTVQPFDFVFSNGFKFTNKADTRSRRVFNTAINIRARTP